MVDRKAPTNEVTEIEELDPETLVDVAGGMSRTGNDGPGSGVNVGGPTTKPGRA